MVRIDPAAFGNGNYDVQRAAFSGLAGGALPADPFASDALAFLIKKTSSGRRGTSRDLSRISKAPSEGMRTPSSGSWGIFGDTCPGWMRTKDPMRAGCPVSAMRTTWAPTFPRSARASGTT